VFEVRSKHELFGEFYFKIMSKICGIYKITSPTGKIYIGQSVDIKSRWSRHKWLSLRCCSTILYKSIRKYGFDNHTFEIIKECKKSELNKLERAYIEKYDTFESNHGMNLTKGGDSNVVLSKSTIEKIRRASKGNKNRLGMHNSDEAREKLRQANLGKKASKETRRKISEGHIGKKYPNRKRYSEEFKAESSRKRTGKKRKINGTSKYFGVRLMKTESNKKWRATITINKKQNHIGVFHTEIEAAKAYDNFVKENVPFKVPLNFE
jgi:group I intron endonuclease